MPMRIDDKRGDVALQNPAGQEFGFIKFPDFGGLVAAHHCQCEPPARLEACGANLVSGGFNPEHAVKFATAVIRWGGGLRLISGFKEGNRPKAVGEKLREAWTLLSGKQGGEPATVAKAVAKIAELHGIRQSFASKIVRFLAPDRAVILDAVIRSKLGYPESEGAYAQFLTECLEILDRVVNEFPHFRVSDIDAAVFAKLQDF